MRIPEKPIDWKKALEGEDGLAAVKAINDPERGAKIRDFNKRYLYWDEVKHRVSERSEQKLIWTAMKLLRSGRYEPLPLKSIQTKHAPIPDIRRSLRVIDKFLGSDLSVQSKSLGLEKRYIVSSLMEEAIASSILEGAVTTRKAAKEMLRQKRKPRNKSEQMVVNGYGTMQMIMDQKEERLTQEFILKIQSAITKDTLEDEKDVGKFRDTDNVIIGDIDNPDVIYHIPPSHDKIKEMINDLCEFANDDEKDFFHPIIKGIILHFMIGYIHPFNDGNGRTARSVFYWYALSRGYWLFEYLSLSRRILRSKRDYGRAYLYTEYDELDLTYFIKYNLRCIEDSINDLMDYLKVQQMEQKEAQKIIDRTEGLNPRQANILEAMIKSQGRLFSIKEISETYSIVYQTARTDLLLLTQKGFLTMKKVSKSFMFRVNLKKS